MNDIADTSVCIQTSAQFVSLRREQDARSFFRALMLYSRKRASLVMGSRAEKKRAELCRGHMNTRSIGETWRHRLSPITQQLRRSAFHEKNYRPHVPHA